MFSDIVRDPSPYYACRASVTAHPLYRKCGKCPHRDYCDLINDNYEIIYDPDANKEPKIVTLLNKLADFFRKHTRKK